MSVPPQAAVPRATPRRRDPMAAAPMAAFGMAAGRQTAFGMVAAPMAAARMAAIRPAAALALALGVLAPGVAVLAPPAQAQRGGGAVGTRIVAVVSGDVVTTGDVDNRARLFALSSGLPTTNEVIERLKPQITTQLIDERLRLQEAQRRKVVVPDQQIAGAVQDIEQRNGMPSGGLRQKLAALGVSHRTLLDQIRIQIAWTQVLREQLGEKLNIAEAEVDEQMRLHQRQIGKPEYRVGEIFLPVDDPANTADARRFAETVIAELRAGAAFPAVAAQFGQTQTALEGGALGWVQPNQLDPQVARMVADMPVGAISNPVKVPGGFTIVSLQGKREVGRDMATFIALRQVFLPFDTPLDPQNPTEQQRQALDKARGLTATVKSCPQMEQTAQTLKSPRPSDPGEIRLETVSPPPFRELITKLPVGQSSQPLVANDGIAVVIVCSREQRNTAVLTKDDVRRRLVAERVELASRQLMRDLRRKASIERVDRDGPSGAARISGR